MCVSERRSMRICTSKCTNTVVPIGYWLVSTALDNRTRTKDQLQRNRIGPSVPSGPDTVGPLVVSCTVLHNASYNAMDSH